MSEFKTIAYDHLKLYGPKILPIQINYALPEKWEQPYRNVPTDLLRKAQDDYKVIYEFAVEVLGKRDFTQWDIVRYYRVKAVQETERLYKKERDIIDGGQESGDRIFGR